MSDLAFGRFPGQGATQQVGPDLLSQVIGQRGNPLQMLAALRAANQGAAPAPSQGGSDDSGSALKTSPADDISMPDIDGAMSSGVGHAANSTRRQAPADRAKTSANSGPLGFHPGLIDLAREMAPTDEDKGTALSKAGFSMAEAAGHTGNFLTALASGANQGINTLQQLRAQRAEMALKANEQNNTAAYQAASLAQTGAHQTALEDLQRQQLAISQREAELKEKGFPAEMALKIAQAEAQKGQRLADDALVRLRDAQANSLTGNGSGIPKDILKEAGIQASKGIINKVYRTPEEQAADLSARTTAIAKDLMNKRGMDISGIAAFNPPTGAPGAVPGGAPPPTPPSYMTGPFAIPEATAKGASDPLLKNPVVMVPGNKIEELVQQGTFGAIDLGTTRNQAEVKLNQLKLDFQNLAKGTGRAVKDQFETINKMMPKQGVFVSAPENFDRLTEIWKNTQMNYDQDVAMANNPAVPKAQRDIAAKAAPIEARILFSITGDKAPDAFERFKGPGGGAPPAHPAGAVKTQGGFYFDANNNNLGPVQ